MAQDAVTVEATGNRDKLDALIRVLEPFERQELVQSGMVALGQGGQSISDQKLRPVDRVARRGGTGASRRDLRRPGRPPLVLGIVLGPGPRDLPA